MSFESISRFGPVHKRRISILYGVNALSKPSDGKVWIRFSLLAPPGAALWTDDLVLGSFGKTDFLTSRVWTQAFLFVMRQEGRITHQEFDQAVAKLVAWHYRGIMWNEDTLVAAAELAEWKMDRWPALQILGYLMVPSTDSLGKLKIAVQAIRIVWRRELPVLNRQSFLFAVLAGLQSMRLVNRLYLLIPIVFSVDVLSADEVRDCIAVWKRNPPGLHVP